MDISSWDGTLSSSDFCLAARVFAEKWKKINPILPPWSWVPWKNSSWLASHEVEGYLSLESLCIHRSHEEDHDERSHKGNEEPNCLGNEEDIDNATLFVDGEPLLLEDIEKELPGKTAKVLTESKWTFITQEEHPYLNRPWHKLHPCGTSEWMKMLFLADPSLGRGQGVPVELYLLSWISMVGQVVGLRVPLEMFKERTE